MDLKQLDTNLLISRQPIGVAQLVDLKAQGVAAIVNNRPDGEEAGQPTSEELQRAAEAAGLDYRHIPLGASLTREHIEAMAQAISREDRVVAFCKSGTRSAFLWALAKARLGGDPDQIAEAAADAGYDITPVRAGVDAFAGR
jgi:uncharacterized protein (TIGR01244 family)